jgi:D-sedoheptulose 7-phosphate isomerase
MPSESLREYLHRGLREGAEARQKLAGACLDGLVQAVQKIRAALASGNKLLLFGNGGSAADAQHIAAEFVCRFARDREALPAIALTTDSSALTAIGNDYGFEQIFARQVRALGRPGDVAIGISTSGRSPNIIEGIEIARHLGLTTIALTGGKGGDLAGLAEISLVVPSTVTSHIQEGHIALLHSVCGAVDALLAGEAREETAMPSGRVKQERAIRKE